MFNLFISQCTTYFCYALPHCLRSTSINCTLWLPALLQNCSVTAKHIQLQSCSKMDNCRSEIHHHHSGCQRSARTYVFVTEQQQTTSSEHVHHLTSNLAAVLHHLVVQQNMKNQHAISLMSKHILKGLEILCQSQIVCTSLRSAYHVSTKQPCSLIMSVHQVTFSQINKIVKLYIL